VCVACETLTGVLQQVQVQMTAKHAWQVLHVPATETYTIDTP